MDMDTARLVLEVARLGSFAAVARQRDLDPSTVSRAVALAEQGIGVRLFQRTTRRLSLTQAGEMFVGRMGAVVEEYDRTLEATCNAASGAAGTLRMTASVAFGQHCLTPLMPEFRAAYPGIALELRWTDANIDLVDERIDLAVRLAPSVRGDLICTKLKPTRYRACASNGYLSRTSKHLSAPQDLAEHDTLRFDLSGFRDRWIFKSADGATCEVPVFGAIMSTSALALRDLALAGLGVALLADWLVEEDLAAGTLIDLFPEHEVTATSFETAAWLLYPSRSFLPHKVRLMIDFLKVRLAD